MLLMNNYLISHHIGRKEKWKCEEKKENWCQEREEVVVALDFFVKYASTFFTALF